MYLAALAFYFFKNCRVATLHSNPNPHPCFLGPNAIHSKVLNLDLCAVWRIVAWLLPTIMRVWPYHHVLWSYTSKWDFFDQGSFITSKNSIDQLLIPLPCGLIDQHRHCRVFQRFNRIGHPLWRVFPRKPEKWNEHSLEFPCWGRETLSLGHSHLL